MKIKEYAIERIKDIQEFLKGDGIEESIKRNNYSVIEILEYIEDMCMAEVKETLERFEKTLKFITKETALMKFLMSICNK